MNAKDMTQTLMTAALENYRRDGNVHPAIFFTEETGEQVIMSCACQLHPPDEMAQATFAVRHMRPWRFVSTVMEAWSKETEATKEMTDEERDALWREFPRGELQRRAESGDETIRTVLVVVTYDPTDWDATESLMLWPELPERETQATTGRPEGQAADDIVHAWESSPTLPADMPADIVNTRSFAAAILAKLGVASSIVAHLSEDEAELFGDS